MRFDIAVLKQRLEWSHLTFSMSSKMAFRLETLILALIVHNASPTPARKFMQLNVENVRWDDMEISTTPSHTSGDQKRWVILLVKSGF